MKFYFCLVDVYVKSYQGNQEVIFHHVFGRYV